MTTKVSTKVRLVRCPKCRQVLAELPGVPLYKCGGCGTILQAKNRNMETGNSELSSQETDSVAKNQLNDLEEKEEARSSNHDLNRPPKVESSLDKSNIRCQDEHGDGSMELCEDNGVSEGISYSLDTSLQNEGSPVEEKESLKCDNSLGQNSKRLHVKSQDEVGEWTSNIRCRDEHGDCSTELCNDKTEGISCPPEGTSLRNEALPVEDKEPLECHNPLGQNSERHHVKSQDDKSEWTRGRNFSSEFSSSSEFMCEAEVYSSDGVEHVEQEDRVDRMECGESEGVWQEGDNFVDEVQNLPKHEKKEKFLPAVSEQREGIQHDNVPSDNDEKIRVCFTDQSGDFDGGNKNARLGSSSRVISFDDNNITKSTEESMGMDDGAAGQLPIFISSSTERNMNTSVIDSIMARQSPLNESLVSHYLTSPEDELLDSTHKFERISSIYSFGSSAVDDLSSELNSKHPSMTNYPTGSYDAYDGSESSYDGTDDQIQEHISHPLRKSKDVDHISTREMLRKERLRVNKVMSSGQERNYWATSSSHLAPRNGSRSLDISAETNWYTSGNRMRHDKHRAGSRLPFTKRDPPVGHRTLGISSYQHHLLPPRHGLLSSDKPSYLEPDNVELSRTVWELKDQLNRMQFSKTNRRFPAEVVNGKFTAFHYDHIAPEREIYADHRSSYNPQFNQAKGYAKRCNVARRAFLGEAGHYRHQVSCSCLHCCPQDWHWPAQLPSWPVRSENGHHLVHNDRNFCDISSPQHYTSSELSLWGCETKSDNQSPDGTKRLPSKERYHTVKRHIRPIAGGAPVISCYYCSELLQLPADFLLFKKRYHRLMCNACKKVLKFSLLKGTHIVPYLPDASAPPPSEVDDHNDATAQRNLDPLSHSSSCQNAEPVSCSDDYGLSFCRSCSTEGEASVILSSFEHAESNPYNRKMSSGSSYEPMEDRKMKSIAREPHNSNASLLKNVESLGPSTEMPKWRKATSEIEELPTSSNSPLHRLMGYSSPSQILNK